MANIKKDIRALSNSGLRPWMISLMLVILFSYVTLLFVIQFIQISNPTNPILTESQYRLNSSAKSLLEPLNNFNNLKNSLESQMADESPSATDYLFLVFKGAFYVPYTSLTFITFGGFAIIQVLFGFFTGGIFGMLIGLLLSGMIITGIFYIISAIRSGNSER